MQSDVVSVSPGVVQYTGDVLFNDLWLRPALAPRDRSMVTVSSLIANGQVAQMPYHLNRAMDNGLTQTEAGEMLAHLAFYAGWPNVFSAIPVAKTVFESRPSDHADVTVGKQRRAGSAPKARNPMPGGTLIALEDCRDGKLFR